MDMDIAGVATGDGFVKNVVFKPIDRSILSINVEGTTPKTKLNEWNT